METESEQLGRQEVGKRATEEGISRRQGLTVVGAAGWPGKAGEWKPKAACSGLKKEFEPSMPRQQACRCPSKNPAGQQG